jgi:valyl-tRNA synthetase
MMMMGIHFMGQPPFKRILLHGMVVDETGDKMSKVKGNTIDPLDLVHGASFQDVVQKALPGASKAEALNKFKKAYPSTAQMGSGFPAYGSDAVRFTLCSYSPQARRIALSPKRIEGYRNFCNKIYNAVRFALGHVAETMPTGTPISAPQLLQNRWILSRLAKAIRASELGICEFRLDEASGALYHFFWDELCDWYLETTKPVFTSGTDSERTETRETLAHVIETALRALHPFMPFITEELWQRVPRPTSRPKSIALAPYPTAEDGRIDEQSERVFTALSAAIGAARSMRNEHDVHPSAEVPLVLRLAAEDLVEALRAQRSIVRFLVRTAGDPIIEVEGGERPKGYVVAVVSGVQILVGLKGLVDLKKEGERIARAQTKLAKDIESYVKRLNNPSFVEKASAEVVAEARAQVAALNRQLEQLNEAASLLPELE